ncbi:HAMP domain-containing histidine kinase [candidate division KSB1 bacterium]|nr:HAMP domain-containing histidine kinase [candidate division KSB1 bacterium]
MKKLNFLIHPVVVFVLAQLAWLLLLGIWIYWYVSNYIIFNKVGEKLSPQLVAKSTNIIALVSGIVFLVAILVGMYLIFIYLNRQVKLTKLYDKFVANVTHELKSPLTSIQLYLETIHLRDVPQEKQRQFIELMLKDTNRLQSLINSILEIAGLEQKNIAHNFQIYQADSIIKTLIRESMEQFNLPPGAIEIQGEAPCKCVLDRDALKIVFNNLIDNAIKYSISNLRLTIKMACSAKYFEISFRDRGIGILPKDQKKIFHKFQRIYGKNNPTVKGTGLGLYWVKEIIKYHGGKVTVSSAGRDKGSTFRIELPIYQTSKRRYVNYLLKITKRNGNQTDNSTENQPQSETT